MPAMTKASMTKASRFATSASKSLCLALFALGAGACGEGGESGATGDQFVPIAASEGITYASETFDLAPTVGGTHCMRVPMPERFRDVDTVLVGMDADLPLYTHHFFMSYSEEPFPGPGDEPVPCLNNEGFVPIEETANEGAVGGGKIVMGAGVGVTAYRAPENTGRLLRSGGHFITNHHVLNLSPESVALYSKINLLLRPASEVEYPTNALNCLSVDVNMAPGEERTVTATCLAPFDLDLALLGSHMHQHGRLFEVSVYDGQTQQTRDEVIYTSDDWDSPEIIGVAPIRLRAGDGLTFTCHFINDSDAPVTYGLDEDSEMCAFMGGFSYPQDQPPPQDPLPPSLGTLITNNDVSGMLIDTTAYNFLPF